MTNLHEVLAKPLKDGNHSVALVEGATTGGQIAMWMSESPVRGIGGESRDGHSWSVGFRRDSAHGAVDICRMEIDRPDDWLQRCDCRQQEDSTSSTMQISCYSPRRFMMIRLIPELSFVEAMWP